MDFNGAQARLVPRCCKACPFICRKLSSMSSCSPLPKKPAMPSTKVSAEVSAMEQEPEQDKGREGRQPVPVEVQEVQSLEVWLEKTLRAFPGGKEVVLEKLKEDWCTDYASLVDCWEDLKDNIPGVLRNEMSTQLARDRFDKVDAVPQMLAGNWMVAFGLGLMSMLVPSILAVFKHRGRQTEEVVEQNVYEVWVPVGLFCILQQLGCMALAPQTGWSMIEQRSNGINMREAMRNNLTNLGVIAVLFLTVVWTMAVDQTMAGDDRFSLICQWYEGFLAIAVGQLIVAVMTCAFITLYLEPLDDMASLKFVKDNFVFFGEPMVLMLAGVYNSLCATVLWVYAVYGVGLGVCFSIAAGGAVLRLSAIYGYLCRWQNPYLTPEDRDARRRDAASMARAGDLKAA